MITEVVETRCGPVEYSEAGAWRSGPVLPGTGVTGDVMLSVNRR